VTNAPEKAPSPWTFASSGCIEQPARSPVELRERVKTAAAQLGIATVGFAPASDFEQARSALDAWLASGYHGTMDYLQAPPRSEPRSLLASASTMVAVAAPYGSEPAGSRRLPLLGQVATYAHGPDYHGSLRHTLSALGQIIADHAGRDIVARACVDTAPLLEREAVRSAGLGFIGKSNMLIVPGVGSRVLLGVLLVDVEIATDAPQVQRCGRCDACLRACPTQAFVGPWLLDARRCISYLTIEYQGWIPLELRPLIGTRVFGCDECQDVCPYNAGGLGPGTTRGSQLRHELHASGPASSSVVESLKAWLRLTSSDYRRLTAGSAMRRTNRAQLLRNAAVAAGNAGSPELVEPLHALLTNSTYPIVRGHAAWALGRLGATEVLRVALATELDEQVHDEIASAIK
jgi:epoxyqueuosine reductase